MAYIQAYSLLSDPEYINIVYIWLHANYLNKILFKLKYKHFLAGSSESFKTTKFVIFCILI